MEDTKPDDSEFNSGNGPQPLDRESDQDNQQRTENTTKQKENHCPTALQTEVWEKKEQDFPRLEDLQFVTRWTKNTKPEKNQKENQRSMDSRTTNLNTRHRRVV